MLQRPTTWPAWLAMLLSFTFMQHAAAQTYAPVGVQQNVPVATVSAGGWSECYRETYGQTGTPIATILANCSGSQLMLACRATGNANLSVLAQAPRAEVIFDTGTGNTTRSANGAEWYFNNSWSWGFAPGGQAVTRSSCDTTNMGNNDRICYHTGGGNMNGGWRCGSNVGLNSSGAFEKVIYHNGAPPVSVAGAPTAATAVAGNAQASVSFTAPASNGGSPITGYRVTSSPGGVEATGLASPITVTGLTNGTSYTFTVIAINAVGDSAPSAPSNAVVPLGPPTLSNFNDVNRTFGDPDFALTAPTSDSAGAFTYTSSNPAVATISGDVVTIVGAGTSTITANQAADGGFTAGSTSATLTVAKAAPVITWVAPFSRVFGDADFTLPVPTSNSPGVISTNSSDTSVATLSGFQVSIVGAGSTTLSVFQAEDANFLAGGVAVSFTVDPAAPALTWIAPLSRTFGDAAFALDPPGSNSPGAFSYTSSNPAVATVSGNTVTIVGAGTATLTASQAADVNYTAGSITTTLTVATANPGLAGFGDLVRTFGDAAFSLAPPSSPSTGAFTYTSSNPAVATVSGDVVTITGAGVATLTANQAADGNYSAASTTATLTVNKAAPALTWVAPLSRTFNDPVFVLPAPTSNSTGAFTYTSSNPAVATVSGNTVTIVGAGTTTLTASQADDANYLAGSVTTTLAVDQAAPAITWVSAINRTFGDAAFALPVPGSNSTGAFTYASSNPAVATVSGNTVTIVSAGTATITASQAADANYVAGSASLALTVGKAAPSLSWIADILKTYGEPAFDLANPTSPSPGAFTFSSANTAVATVSGRTVTITGSGTTVLTATQAETANYAAASVTTTLRVGARPDPTQDPGVVAGLQAQVDASVRFVAAQQTNIRDRLRQVRGGNNGSSNALSLNLGNGHGPGLSLNAGQAVGGNALPLPEGWGWWTAGAITFGDRDPSANSGGFGFQSDGISLGVDRRVGENAVLGVTVGTGFSDADFDADSSSLGGRHNSLAIYGLWRNERLYLDGVLGTGRLDFDIRRYSALVNNYGTATREGDQRFASLTVGHESHGESIRLATYGRFDASRTDLDAYRESGLGIYDLSYGGQRIDTTSLSLGAEGGSSWFTRAGVVRPYWMVEYRMSLKDQSDVGINYVVLPNASDYLLRLRSYADDAVVWGGGLDLDLGPRWGLALLYRGENVSGIGHSYSVGLQLSWKGGMAPAALSGEASATTESGKAQVSTR